MGLLIYIFIWHSLDSRRDSLLPSRSADRNVFTLTPPKSTGSNSLTPARTSASLLRTTSLKRERPLSTLDSELRPGTPPSVRDVTPVPEEGREPETPVCLPRSSGWEDLEFSEDSSVSTERPRRSLLPSTDRCTSEPRVTCTRTRTSSSSPSTRIRLTRSVKESSRPRERPDVPRTPSERRRDPPARPPSRREPRPPPNSDRLDFATPRETTGPAMTIWV